MHQRAAPLSKATRKRPKWRPWVLFVILAAIVGAGVYLVQLGPDPIAITTERVTIRDITELVSATGQDSTRAGSEDFSRGSRRDY